jgi:RHS repeat-associated protein
MTTATICATREVSWSLSFYRGEQYDPDLGLYYLRARYYNPATGRFMSRDPEDHDLTDPGKLHKYLYSHGDPINWRDPTGRDDEDEDVFLVTLNTTVRNSTGVYRLVRTACMFEVMYAGIAEVTKAAAKYFWGRKEGPLPEPPLWLDAACIVVLGKAQLLDLWDHVLELSALY